MITNYCSNKIKKNKIKFLKKILKQKINLYDKDVALISYKELQKILDKYSKKRIIHKNKAARYKSSFIKKINMI